MIAFVLCAIPIFPGGTCPAVGVERGEHALDAAMKEAREEAGLIIAPDHLILTSIHSNFAHFKGDHVLLYRANAWTTSGNRPCSRDCRIWLFPLGRLAPIEHNSQHASATGRGKGRAYFTALVGPVVGAV
jgi:ADP-ribose pyrophosphatase YjhB (NUDIX family)